MLQPIAGTDSTATNCWVAHKREAETYMYIPNLIAAPERVRPLGGEKKEGAHACFSLPSTRACLEVSPPAVCPDPAKCRTGVPLRG